MDQTTSTPTTSPTSTTAVAARIRRRWARAALALAVPAAVAAPIAAATPAHAVADCTTDCVTVKVTSGTDRFNLAVTTSTSAKIAGKITTQDGGTTVTTTATSGFTTSTSLSVSNLKMGVGYRYDVYGTDTSGNTWRETGYFSTLVRDVAIQFDTLQITDDGDVGSPGELVGAAQILDQDGNTCAVKPLAPLKMTSTTSMSSGSPVSVDGASDLGCAGVGPGIWLQEHLADDDTDAWDDCDSWWPWHFSAGSWGGKMGGNDCADWNYGTDALTDPMLALGTGSASVPFSFVSQGNNTYDWDAGPEWVVKGSAVFTHRLPALAQPATTGGQVKLPLTMTSTRGGFIVGWTPQAVPGSTFYTYQVQWRRTGTTTWSSKTVNAPGTSATITGLDGAAAYDVQVLAGDHTGAKLLRSAKSVTTQPLTDPTTISGWSAGSATLAPGTSVPFTASVSGDPRPVQLQTRHGGGAWTTHANLVTTAGDQVTGSYPVLPGVHEWRLFAPQSGFFAAATSPVVTVTSTSAITGFETTKLVAPAGTIVKDAVTVTPGAGRQVVVQYLKSGSATWRTYATVTASDTGKATLRLKAFKGVASWRATVAESPEFGTAATTVTRTVRGK